MVTLGVSKAILVICNFLLLICGFTLITGGLLLLFDTDTILLSRLFSSGALSNLSHPLLYYVALGFSVLGLILVTTGVVGCWASCIHSYWILTVYFLVIILLLICECVIFAIVWAWPQCLGLGLDSMALTKNLQNNYGKLKQEEFTAAVDLAQTKFRCCGVESATEYDTSLWRLQSLSHNLAVPLTCCKLANYNFNRTKSYLNPEPINTTLCQALEANRHEEYRQLKGCGDLLDEWYRYHYMIFLASGLVIVLVEFVVLLSTLLTCTKIYQYKQSMKEDVKTPTEPVTKAAKSSQTFSRSPITAYSNETYDMTDTFRPNYKLVDTV